MLTKTLNDHYRTVKTLILDKQHPVTGLLPASTAITIHGNYRDAWVRDNVYSIMAVWALALAYRKENPKSGRTQELEFSTLKLMRGLLRAMMRQHQKVETFKKTLALHDALHAKYDTATGQTVVGDHDWGHLQIDATSLFLLTMVQMIGSGIRVIQTQDEADFIQNLVYYIERAYRIPDYGIWERGEKTNAGYVELNASSLGMALAALEALDNFNLLGYDDLEAVIQVIPDNIASSRTTLHALLPRESRTKETDAALLSIIGFPAFAVTDRQLKMETQQKIRNLLAGSFGYKRFLRDGHQTTIEDPSRHYYQPEELKQFEHIESEWPLFFIYEYLNSIFDGRLDEAQHFRRKIEEILVLQEGQGLVPELYFLEEEDLEEERLAPGSQHRTANDNLPLTWAQSLLVVGDLLASGHITKHDIDSLQRHESSVTHHPIPVHVVVVADTDSVKSKLAELGLDVETRSELQAGSLRPPDVIAQHFSMVGQNQKMNLTGRPVRRMRTLTTSRLYEVNGLVFSSRSLFFEQNEFYLAYDSQFLVARFKNALRYISKHWSSMGVPVVSILLNQDHLVDEGLVFIDFLKSLQNRSYGDLEVRVANFAEVKNIGHTVDVPPISDLERHRQSDQQPTVYAPILDIRGTQNHLS